MTLVTMETLSAQARHAARQEFTKDWYAQQYREPFRRHAYKDEDPFDFYWRKGGRLGHDPNPYFSELYYRLNTPGPKESMERDKDMFGFLHHLHMRASGDPNALPTQRIVHVLRKLCDSLDEAYIVEQAGVDLESYASFADFYISKSLSGVRIDPNPKFSESYYLDANPDVRAAKEDEGTIISGYQHYLEGGQEEGRAVLSARSYVGLGHSILPELRSAMPAVVPQLPFAHPVELGIADAFKLVTRKLDITIDPLREKGDDGRQRAPGMIVMLRDYCPEISFGGYMALFDFLRLLKAKRAKPVRLIICDDDPYTPHQDNIAKMRKNFPDVARIFDDIQILCAPDTKLSLPADCDIISHSAETHFFADQVGQALGRLPYFFTQDDEAAFHPNDSMSSLVYSAKAKPHFGIFNSEQLAQHLMKSETYPNLRLDLGFNYVSFENRIEPMTESYDAFQSAHTGKRKRSLLLYGRPERYCARNQYGFALAGLRQAIEADVFDETWTFTAIGSLEFSGAVELGKGRVLHQYTRMPRADYEDMVTSADIGVSFISTPHPGIIHFQMAASGALALTNVGPGRSKESLQAISRNLEPVDLTLDSFERGLADLVARCGDLEQRYAGAVETQACFDQSSLLNAVMTVADRMSQTEPKQ